MWFFFTPDIDECASSPCVQGTCVDEIARYRCVCEALFIGINCEQCEFELILFQILNIFSDTRTIYFATVHDSIYVILF